MLSKENPSTNGNNLSVKDDDDHMNDEEEDDDNADIDEGTDKIGEIHNNDYNCNNNDDDIEMNGNSSDEEESVSAAAIDPIKKQRELEKRLQSELNLRMGQMAFAYENDEDEEDQQENGGDHDMEEIKHNSHHSKKKKASSKKMKETSDNNNKLKQTRLIFTPKDSVMTGTKRHHPESGSSPNEFDEEE